MLVPLKRLLSKKKKYKMNSISIFEQLCDTNAVKYVLLSKLTIKEYVRLGLSNKFMYKLLNIDLYKNMLREVSTHNYTCHLGELDKKEFEELPFSDIISQEELCNMKQKSVSPIITLNNSSIMQNILDKHSWVHYNSPSETYVLYTLNDGKITKKHMVPLFNTNSIIDTVYYNESLKIINRSIIAGIVPKYEYLMVRKFENNQIIFMVFDMEPPVVFEQCLFKYRNSEIMFEKIVVAFFELLKKLSQLHENRKHCLGDYFYIIQCYIGCVIHDNDVSAFINRYFVETNDNNILESKGGKYYIKHFMECRKWAISRVLTSLGDNDGKVMKKFKRIMKKLNKNY